MDHGPENRCSGYGHRLHLMAGRKEAGAGRVYHSPAAAGVFYTWGLVLSPAVGAVFMSLSTVICAVNAKLLRLSR